MYVADPPSWFSTNSANNAAGSPEKVPFSLNVKLISLSNPKAALPRK